MMRRVSVGALAIGLALSVFAGERVPLWPEGKIPDFRENQYVAPSEDLRIPGFDRTEHTMPYIEWDEPPAAEKKTDACVILISGGGYGCTCDRPAFRPLEKMLLDAGVTCVWLWYRVPRPQGLPIYQTAWEDGQRGVRLVRAAAKARGFDPEKIGVLGCSAGSHLSLMLATSALTPSYARVDALDDIPCHVNFAIPMCPAYVLTDGLGDKNARDGDSPDVKPSEAFRFDAKTCPMCLFHGGNDPYSPNGSTQVYRQLRRMKIPAELHLDPDRGHGPVDAAKFGRALEFMKQSGYLGAIGEEVDVMTRFPDDSARGKYAKEAVWPDGKMPDVQTNQCTPYIEWHFPKEVKTKAIQIVYSGGGYGRNTPDGKEVAPVRRYLNEKGMTVVTLKYRTPAPGRGLAKHISAWQDLQRTIRIVRSKAVGFGLDPDRIGIMGFSAGGHLTLMGATSSKRNAYLPFDELDKTPCDVQWAVAFYPAYALTDGLEKPNTQGGNEDDARPAPEFSFDLATPPILFLHGDADVWAAMNSVKCWEQLRRMGVQGELHTFATRKHCFQYAAAPGTGSYTYCDRVWEFLEKKGFVAEKWTCEPWEGGHLFTDGREKENLAVLIVGGPGQQAEMDAEARLHNGKVGHAVLAVELAEPSVERITELGAKLMARAGHKAKVFGWGKAAYAAARAYNEHPEVFVHTQAWVRDGDPEDWPAWQKVLTRNPIDIRAPKPLRRRPVKPVEVREKDGVTFVDFGKEAFGWVDIRPPAGATGEYRMWITEALDKTGRALRNTVEDIVFHRANLHATRAEGRLDGAAADWTRVRSLVSNYIRSGCVQLPDEYGYVMPLRYIEVEKCPFPVTADSIRMVALEYPYDRGESSFKCSDIRLDWVYDFCKYSIFATSFAGIFVDGNREWLPYEADSLITQLSTYAVTSDPDVARATFELLMGRPTWPTEYQIQAVLIAHNDWMRTGRTDLAAKYYDRLVGEKLMRKYAREDGLLLTGGEMGKGARPGCADIVDWPPPERFEFVFRPVNAVVNAFAIKALRNMADLAGALGKDGDAARFAAEAKTATESFVRVFRNADGLIVDGEGTDHVSLHGNACALALGLVPETDRRAVAKYLATQGMRCSVYIANFLLNALMENGEEVAALALMTERNDRSWLGMMNQGATVTMESWNMNVGSAIDWNHSWGTTALDIIARQILGVKPTKPGYEAYEVKPRLGNLQWAEGDVPTPRGIIHVRAERQSDGTVKVDTSLRPLTAAH